MSLLFSIIGELLNHQVTKQMLRSRNIWGMTPLHLARQEGHYEAVKVLEHHLSAQDISQEDREKSTALHLASESGEREIVLLEEDFLSSEMYLVNNHGKTPMHMAAEGGYIQ